MLINFLLILALLSPLIEGKLSYVFILLLSVLGFLKILTLRKVKDVDRFFFVVIVGLTFFVVISWGYGVVLGLSNGVPTSFVFSNFIGLAFYAFFLPICFIRIKHDVIIKVYVYSSIAVSIFSVVMVFDVLFLGGEIKFSDESISSARIFMSVTQMYSLPMLAIGLLKFTVKKDEYLAFLNKYNVGSSYFGFPFLVLYSFTIIVPAFSKGFILSYAVLIFLFFAFYLFRGVKYVGVYKYLIVVFLTVLSCFYIGFKLHEIVSNSFSSDNVSNSIRSQQFIYLADEIELSGAGLGAGLKSGYKRDETGYGFELTYVNVVHKIGLLSFILFFLYMVTLVRVFFLLMKENTRLIGGFLFGIMLYLIPSSANPMLLSPNFVLGHLLVLIILTSNSLVLKRVS